MTMLYVNNGPHTVYIGGRAISPGEAREVDAALIPAESDPPGDGVPPADMAAGPPASGGGLSPTSKPNKRARRDPG